MDGSPDEDSFPGRLLHQAALWDNLEFLRDLLASGSELAHAVDASGRTALHAAAVGERSRCLRALLDAGARPDVQSDERSGAKTALHISAERGHTENVKALLAAGADLFVQDAGGRTALEAAERAGHRHAAALLRDARDAVERARASRHQQLRELVSRGESGKLRFALSKLAGEAGLLANLAPGGAPTLLYLAAESGATEAVVALLGAGADGRAHPVTRYSPLYAAAYQGHVQIAELLLQHFPELVQQETVERWLPFHAACIGGHVAVVKLLLEFSYPEHMMAPYTYEGGKWRAECAWDVNARDVSGQTGLYVACTLGNLPLVDLLLRHTVLCTSTSDEEKQPESAPTEALSPTRGRISHGIHSIVARLTGQTSAHNEASEPGHRVRPVLLGEGCPGDTCLGAAVRRGHVKVVARLLEAGADPNTPCRDTDEMSTAQDGRGRVSRQRPRSTSALPRRSSPSPSPGRTAGRGARHADESGGAAVTPLALAARARDHQLAELLLAAGATDAQCAALRESALQADEVLLARLLATKAYADPEYKLNRSAMPASVFGATRAGDATLTYSALYPTAPVALNWRDLRAHIAKIRVSWLTQAALHVNNKLSGESNALHALTRIQLSGNELRELPGELFALPSLRHLNVAQNKLERLPTAQAAPEEAARGRGGKRSNRAAAPPDAYSAPVLEELYLQDNRLEELPAALFSLPALATLDVSNNKLRALPAALWRAPRLRDLSAALNHLRDLPPPAHQAVMAESESPSSSPVIGISGSSSASHISHFFFGQQKAASRSPSVDRGLLVQPSASVDEPKPEPEREEGAATLGNRAGNATWSEARRVHVWRRALEVSAECGAGAHEPAAAPHASQLASLNLAHNQFTAVPPALACLAPALTRLNMAYNALRSMSYVTSYPSSLRQLDLSHNEISCWPSLPQMETIGAADPSPLACYCAGAAPAPAPAPAAARSARPRSGGSVRAQLLNSVCPARRHLRLESLRTLILANNLLTRIQLTTDDDGMAPPTTATAGSLDSNTEEDDEWNVMPPVKTRLLFPSLSMLDVSCNMLRAVPPGIHDLTNLAVLNISGNKDITELPPQMGLLSRLWNLNTTGCPLQEPLRTMVHSHKYKTMHVIGYLKSVLEEAQPYNRMKMMLVGAQGRGKTSLLECLRHESAPQHRKKNTEHWSKRMGNKTAGKSPGKNISTVGVDIGTWQYEKQGAATPPLTFNTWDFAGQQEYYATHQYFLSRRSLYLVVWNVTEGRRGLAGVLKWLRSIQARAPGSPAIIVGTHYDAAVNTVLPDGDTAESLQRLIRTHIMCAGDADKLGLPRVWDTLEVSCTTRHNVRLLADMIYTCAYSLKPPGSKEALLEQRVPASYLALEECVAQLAAERRARGLEPVLRHDQYKQQVTQLMQQKFHRSFRDAAELHQATMFLHENGVILHYDDATLKELYFLEPQWLCDMLAHVVTVREINPFARKGIMRLDELPHLFKSSALGCRGEEARSLVVSLLNKFELALGWDGRTLLVPPLLPPNPTHNALILPLRARHWPGSARGTPSHRAWVPPLSLHAAPVDVGASSSGADSPKLFGECGAGADAEPPVSVSGRGGAERALRRLLLLSYVPCGFWPRLITRVLADEAVADVPHHYYKMPHEVTVDAATARALELPATWQLWQSGLRLRLGELTLLTIREVHTTHDEDLFGCTAPLVELEADAAGASDGDDYRSYRYRLKQDGVWCELDAQSSCIVEVALPAEVLCIRRRRDQSDDEQRCLGSYQNISIEPSPEAVARLLALASDHVDLLLEDWYPTLGTRFVHTSEGRCLITRISPCALCLRDPRPPHASDLPPQLSNALKRLEVCPAEPPVRLSTESRASDGDSGVGAESNASSRMPSVEGALAAGAAREEPAPVAYSWSVEECILSACGGAGAGAGEEAAPRALHCPAHGDVALADVAPDTMMLDVEAERVARWESITRGRLLGRGAFGLVFRAEWRRDTRAPPESVALKVLQPVPPGAGARLSARQAYKAAVSRWAREPAAAACRAYCAARQELAVLAPLRHAHVAPLRAVCTAPLALLLELAPMGALDTLLREYRACGARVGARAARALALQVARALEYLHARRIVYRDLKAENVLVWRCPQPQGAAAAERSPAPLDVLVKLGDYGISRLSLPSGTKGFGGTEGFMAPEIMRYNGEEEYTEKVDCFSFGMFLYELLTLRQPFQGHEAVKEAILEGARPPLAPKDTAYPCYMLDLMCCCWCGQPEPRPSASSLVSLCSAPEYAALQDVAGVHAGAGDAAALPTIAAAARVAGLAEDGGDGWEVWWGNGGRIQTLLATPTAFTQHHTVKLQPEPGEETAARVTALCCVGAEMWVGDSAGRITVYDISTCGVAWSCRVEESVGGGSRAGVAAVLSLAPLPRLALAMDTGRLFLVTSERPPAEGSFVLTELGTASSLNCLTATPAPDGWDVWCGGEALWCYEVCAGGVAAAHALDAAPGEVALLAAGGDHVFAYNRPGCVVYQWCVKRHAVTARLDCGKLAPCSESLHSIAIEERLSTGRCQVTALCALGSALYVGTAWGCVIVAETHTLRPITVFRPHEANVVGLVPLRSRQAACDKETGPQEEMLATLGVGYRSLLARYTDLPAQLGALHGTQSGVYCLLWRAGHWAAD